MEKSALFPNNTRRKHKSLSQSLAENITEKIRSGALKPGDKLPTESAIMELYEVSRTVVREAISHLQAGGLVQTRHGIGTFIQEPPSNPLSLHKEAIVVGALLLRPRWHRNRMRTHRLRLPCAGKSPHAVDLSELRRFS